MDRKAILILVVSGILLFVWMRLTNALYPPQPIPATNLVAGATNLSAPTTNALAPPAPVTPVSPAPPAAPGATWTSPEGPEELQTLETADARYVFTSDGAG